ncbi:MAG: sigma-70 family RNA polymerase sigma factor [Tannerella sp.]|jgi:RNA polymerase sigma factor (sigma-70 family)|nr:sigma-70 family RNA polymerase sigma factor [Tannerella sp.]
MNNILFLADNPVMDDSLLWDQFLAGNDDAYTLIYKRYSDKLFAFGLHFSPDRELVKDCIQDVFVKIFANRKRLKPTDNILLYLYIALKNRFYNLFQKENERYYIDTIEPVFTVEYSVEDEYIEREDEKETKSKIKYILELMTPRQKEVMYYRYVEGMDMKAICEITKMNYQSVQNLIQRAIRRVREVYEKKGGNGVSIQLKTNS